MSVPEMRREWLFLESVVVLLVMLGSAHGGTSTGPLETLRSRDQQIRELLGQGDQKPGGKRDSTLRALVSDLVDYEAYARESFGIYWGQVPDQDRVEVLRLLEILVERALMRKMDDYAAERIQYVSESIDADNPGAATVITHVVREGDRLEVGYRMVRTGGQWRIVDILVQGASSVQKNRVSFYKEIHTSGLQSLLERLRKKAQGKGAP